jgi:hypothetical protein
LIILDIGSEVLATAHSGLSTTEIALIVPKARQSR